jgi:hypothetical protein
MQQRNRESDRLQQIGYMSLSHLAYAGYFILDGVSMTVRHVKTAELYPVFVGVAVIMGCFGVGMSKAAFVRSRLARERIGPEPNAFSVRVFRILAIVLTVVMIAFASSYALITPGVELIGHVVPYVGNGNLYLVRIPGSSALCLAIAFAMAIVYVFLAIFVSGMAWINYGKS